MMRYNDLTMYRRDCEQTVSEELAAVSGVEAVEVDLDSKVVTIRGANLADGALRAAIDAAGYQAA